MNDNEIRRVILPEKAYHSEVLSPGVTFESFHPGGVNGPNDECLRPTPGGQTFSEHLTVGAQDSDFQMGISHVRMPANQYWPLHWHDSWTVVLCLEGQCLIGDWWMKKGDILVVEPSLEYGPLVSGPQGSRVFEIFSKAHLVMGGYAPEYRDHPTLTVPGMIFTERSEVNRRNEGKQILSCEGVPGITKSRWAPGLQWDLGEAADPERSVMNATMLAANERRGARRYPDWHFIMVLQGSIGIAGRTLRENDYLIIGAGSMLDEIQAGTAGAGLLEMTRTAQEAIAVDEAASAET